jgi:hypothetical protein
MKKARIFRDRFRYWVLAIAFCCLMSVSSNISAFNIAQVCMSTGGNGTEVCGFLM